MFTARSPAQTQEIAPGTPANTQRKIRTLTSPSLIPHRSLKRCGAERDIVPAVAAQAFGPEKKDRWMAACQQTF
jgi:hypothetical protein